MYSGHNITVIDLNEWKIAYSVPTQGYPQTSTVLTTAYDKGDGTVYIYMFDNFTPGKLRVLCDKPGAPAPVSVIFTKKYKKKKKKKRLGSCSLEAYNSVGETTSKRQQTNTGLQKLNGKFCT